MSGIAKLLGIAGTKSKAADGAQLQGRGVGAATASAAGVQEDKLICLIRTNEPHLRRAVERRSEFWVENKSKFLGGGAIFDVKFEFQDQPADYSSLRAGQMFNHFQSNTEITTKSGLCKNLYLNTSPCMKVDEWFPRCYDLSQAG